MKLVKTPFLFFVFLCTTATFLFSACSPQVPAVPSPAVSAPLSSPSASLTPTAAVLFDKTFEGDGEKSWTDYFDVPLSEPYYRVWVRNTGDSALTIRLTSGSYTGELLSEFTVPAGEEEYRDLQICSDDARRYLSIIGTSGNRFSGRLYIHSASGSDSLQFPSGTVQS